MKQICLLTAAFMLFILTSQAQSTTTVEKQTNRITITTTHTGEDGKPVTETWIAEGEQPEVILKEMAIHPDVLRKVDIDKDELKVDGERLFLFRQAGDERVIEGRLNENAAPKTDENQDVVIIVKDDGSGKKEYRKVSTWTDDGNAPKVFVHRRFNSDDKPNCAALGVFIQQNMDQTGCRISSLIDRGGAEAAGLLENDMITRIDEFEVTDFNSLHLALANFLPGDRVTVRYDRDGKSGKAKVRLTSWADLPGHEWRARNDCDQPGSLKEAENDPQLEDDPNGLTGIQSLELTDAKLYPNPTDGVVSLSFTAKPGPISVSISDINGKVVYQEAAENATGYYNRDIDLRDMPTGNYVLTVKQGEAVFTQQVSRQ